MTANYKLRTVNFGKLNLTLEVFANPEREFDLHFDQNVRLEKTQTRTSGDILAGAEPPLFGCLWPAAEGLAQYLWQERKRLKGQRILEIGCGLGLPSLVCAYAGASVVAMDHHPDFAALLKANLERNGFKPAAIAVTIASFTDTQLDLGQFSMIIGSDILYEPQTYSQLETFVLRHGAEPAELVLADPGRYAVEDFGRLLRSQGEFQLYTQDVQGLDHPIEIRSFCFRQKIFKLAAGSGKGR